MYVEREITAKFRKLAQAYSLLALVGARQSGKTTFLKHEMQNQRITYLLFDDPDIRSLFEEDIKKFERQYLEDVNLSIFDEVQNCKNAGINLKYLSEKGHKIWMTASSETILGKEVLSYLVGRVSILKLHPFSIQEFLNAKGQKEFNQAILSRLILEHMAYGGYPKVVLTNDDELKKIILRDLNDTLLLKDVARTFTIQDTASLEQFTKYLSHNISGILNYETISSDLKISFQTTKKYLDALEKSYMIARIVPFFTNKQKEIAKQPKIYFIDTGLRNIIANALLLEPDGKLFENYVLTELLKCQLKPKYWRTKTKMEVDFIIEKEEGYIPIEVKLHADSVPRNLHSFITAYKPKTAFIVTFSGENKTEAIGNCTVHFCDILTLTRHLQ